MSATQDVDPFSQPFEIGLVMAGAISAGAYTAGVMDFLLQALDAWYGARAAGEDVPPHEVRIKVMTGASAGGMTAAISVGALATRFPPVTDPAAADSAVNKLFDSWVNRIDIAALLGAQDLADPKAPVRSVLDSTILRTIADQALGVAPAAERRAYLDDVLHVIATVSNLRGVPYSIPLEGEIKGGQDLFLHADYFHFAVSDHGEQSVPGALSLDWQMADARWRPGWDTLKLVALATGAFPVGLAPRTLSYDFAGATGDVYALRKWPVPTGGAKDANGDCHCVEYKVIAPNWPAVPQRYDFVCVDGGLMNNEPLELARQVLAGSGGYNPRGANSARRAVILVDPFPGGAEVQSAYEPRDDLVTVVKDMFNALKNQARFKPEELELAQDPNVFSRFLIGPTRTDANGRNCEFPIASGTLGGFGGFLSRDFRLHDFMLGRRNCQRFLGRRFVLGENNPLFDRWKGAQRERYAVERDGHTLLPVVPLVGEAATEVPALPWPRYPAARLAELEKQIEARFTAVGDRLVSGFLADKYFARKAAQFALWRKRGDLVQYAMDRVKKDLARFGLLA